ncbi:MAG TPA: thioredoxin family protein [Candidatus Dormibacteraeota bacterium]|nr:thioredoxin family protein [Candidatus Dormibacteraeota bacterium]
MIDERTKAQVRERLGRTLQEPTELRLYRRPDTGRLILPGGLGCQTCDAAEELARTLAEAAPGKLRLAVVDVTREPVEVEAVPSLTVARVGDEPRITFQGLPAGYEFATLIDAIERVSGKGEELSAGTMERLASLDREVEVMVFVTPTCPYCPAAASMANRMALASPKVRSLVVEANEYPELADRYQVQGVPRTVVNRSGAFVGALPEAAFVDAVLQLAMAEVAR